MTGNTRLVHVRYRRDDHERATRPNYPPSPLTSGSAGLLVDLLPTGTEWYVDDTRARKLVTLEPTTTLGPVVRN